MTSNNLKNQNETFKEFFQVQDDGNLICSASETYFPAISCDTITATTQVISNVVISDYSVTGEVSATGDVIGFVSSLSPISLKNVSDLLTITTNSRLNTIDILNNTQNSRLDLIDILNITQNTRLNLVENQMVTANSNITDLQIVDVTQNSRLSSVESINNTQNTRLQSLENLVTGSSNLVNDITQLKNKTAYMTSFSDFRTDIDGTLNVWTSGGDENLGEINASYKISSGFSMDAPYINATTQLTTLNLTVLNGGAIEYEDDGDIFPFYVPGGSFQPSENASISQTGVITGTKLVLNDTDVQIDGVTGHASIISIGAQTLELSKDLKLANLATTQLSTLSAVKGSTVYNIDDNKINVYDGEAWGEVGGGGGLENPIYSELAIEQIQIQNGVDVGVKFDQPRPIPEYNGTIRYPTNQSELSQFMMDSSDGDVICLLNDINLISTFIINKRIKLTAINPNIILSYNGLNLRTVDCPLNGILIQGITIRSLGTGSNESCIWFNDPDAINNYVDNVHFIADEFAIITSNYQIQITNCTFNYARAPAGEAHRYIALNATKGITFINNNVFNGSSPSANGTQCISTANSLTSNFVNGKIYVQNNLALNNPVQRLLMNEVSLTGTNVSFYFTNNQIKTSSGFVIFYQSPALGGIKEIWALDNVETLLTADTGKGIIGLDFPSGSNLLINQDVKINSRNNEPGNRRVDYSNASDELNVLCYVTARFTPPNPLFNTEYFDNLYLKNKLYDSNLNEIPVEYLTNITSDVQAQLNASLGPSFFTGTVDQVVKGNGTIGNILNTDLPANIDASKIANGLVSNTEFQFLDGVTSAIQTQLNSKLSTITNANLPNGIDSAKIANGSVSNTEFQFLDGLTSNIQSQLNNSLNQAFFTGTVNQVVKGNGTIGNLTTSDLPENISATSIGLGTVDDFKFDYLNSLTSNVQTQLNGKLNLTGGILTGPLNGTAIVTSGNISCSQLTCNGTGALRVPRGTTNQRPGGDNGLLRYNTTTAILEGYSNGAWRDLVAFNPTITTISTGDSLFYDGTLWRNGYYTVAPIITTTNNITITANNLVSPYSWNGSSSMQMQIFVYSNSQRTIPVAGSPFTVTSNTKTFTVGPGNELPEYNKIYYMSSQVRPNIADYPNTYSPLRNHVLTTPQLDEVRAQLSSSLSSYDSAVDNSWVNITQSEYIAICNNVTGVNLCGYNTGVGASQSWGQGNTASQDYGAWYNLSTFFTTPIDNSYLVAIRFKARVDGTTALTPRVGFGKENQLDADTSYLNFSIPNTIQNGVEYYQCRKKPSLTIANRGGANTYPILIQDAGVGLTSPFMSVSSITSATSYWFTTSGTITNGQFYTLATYSPPFSPEYLQYALTRTKTYT